MQCLLNFLMFLYSHQQAPNFCSLMLCFFSLVAFVLFRELNQQRVNKPFKGPVNHYGTSTTHDIATNEQLTRFARQPLPLLRNPGQQLSFFELRQLLTWVILSVRMKHFGLCEQKFRACHDKSAVCRNFGIAKVNKKNFCLSAKTKP